MCAADLGAREWFHSLSIPWGLSGKTALKMGADMTQSTIFPSLGVKTGIYLTWHMAARCRVAKSRASMDSPFLNRG
jgi:hypothetical protein